jgi:hemerythrin-like domain-containing protein
MAGKRHPSLIPLSHDHHQGLALAFRLTREPPAPQKGAWSIDPQEQARETISFFHESLVPHFQAEEEVLFPGLLAYLGEHKKIVIDLLENHQQLRALIAEMEAENDPAQLTGHLRAFADLLEHHIRREERELFPIYEKRVPPAEAEKLGKELDKILHPSGPQPPTCSLPPR